MTVLKKTLFDEYGGFSDRRIKKLDSGSTFVADDRGRSDHGADKKLFLWFCMIFVEVKSDSEVEVRLIGGLPLNDEVREWAARNNFELKGEIQSSLTMPIKKGEENKLIELAQLVESMVSSGRRYPVPAYKYVCPRTGASLRRLETSLSKVWDI